MKIKGAEGLTAEQVMIAVQRGSKFVVFEYCISVVILTFKRPSAIYFVGPEENRLRKGLPYFLLSLLAGWWGIPWGPIYTLQVLNTDLRGGKDVTKELLPAFAVPAPAESAVAMPAEDIGRAGTGPTASGSGDVSRPDWTKG